MSSSRKFANRTLLRLYFRGVRQEPLNPEALFTQFGRGIKFRMRTPITWFLPQGLSDVLELRTRRQDGDLERYVDGCITPRYIGRSR
jgi:hypothetical protein